MGVNLAIIGSVYVKIGGDNGFRLIIAATTDKLSHELDWYLCWKVLFDGFLNYLFQLHILILKGFVEYQKFLFKKISFLFITKSKI